MRAMPSFFVLYPMFRMRCNVLVHAPVPVTPWVGVSFLLLISHVKVNRGTDDEKSVKTPSKEEIVVFPSETAAKSPTQLGLSQPMRPRCRLHLSRVRKLVRRVYPTNINM